MTAPPHPITAADLLHMPDDGCRTELVRGELVRRPYIGFYYGVLGGRILERLSLYIDAHELGESPNSKVGFQFADDHVRMASITFIRAERLDALGEMPGYFPGAPDLAIELVTPSETEDYLAVKIRDFLEAGTQAFIEFHAYDRAFVVHRPDAEPTILTESDTLEAPDIIPGWSLPVADIFRRGGTRLSA